MAARAKRSRSRSRSRQLISNPSASAKQLPGNVSEALETWHNLAPKIQTTQDLDTFCAATDIITAYLGPQENCVEAYKEMVLAILRDKQHIDSSEQCKAFRAAERQCNRIKAVLSVPETYNAKHGKTAPDRLAVDHEDEMILQALHDQQHRLLTQDQIEQNSRVSRRTVSTRIKTLLKAGLVKQPKGPKSGTTITSSGIALLARLDNISAQ